MKMSEKINNFLFFILIFSISVTLTKSFSIPLKFNIYQPKDESSLTKEQIFESIEKNYIYSYFEIGNPRKKIPLFLTFNNSFLSIDTDLIISPLIESNYIPSNSKSFIALENNIIQEECEINGKIVNNFTFLYQKSNEKEKNLYGFIGLQNFYDKYKLNDFERPNFIYQLKKSGLIDSISYYINYTSENEGYLYINMDPNDYSPYSFSDSNKYTMFVKELPSKEEKYIWNMDINSLYSENHLNKIIINKEGNNVLALLNPQYGLIQGCLPYKDIIEKNILSDLIEKNICSKSELNEKIFYSCKSDEKNTVKKSFLPLYLYQKDFNYTFELNFDDLFYEKNNILFFLVCFDKNNKNHEWILGKPFMKKYQFSFDVENNKISYYENLNTLPLKYNNNSLYVNQLLPLKNLALISVSMFFIFTSFFCVFYCLKMSGKSKTKKPPKEVIENGKKFIELKESSVVINNLEFRPLKGNN